LYLRYKNQEEGLWTAFVLDGYVDGCMWLEGKQIAVGIALLRGRNVNIWAGAVGQYLPWTLSPSRCDLGRLQQQHNVNRARHFKAGRIGSPMDLAYPPHFPCRWY
jgi:hypothetical protein